MMMAVASMMSNTGAGQGSGGGGLAQMMQQMAMSPGMQQLAQSPRLQEMAESMLGYGSDDLAQEREAVRHIGWGCPLS